MRKNLPKNSSIWKINKWIETNAPQKKKKNIWHNRTTIYNKIKAFLYPCISFYLTCEYCSVETIYVCARVNIICDMLVTHIYYSITHFLQMIFSWWLYIYILYIYYISAPKSMKMYFPSLVLFENVYIDIYVLFCVWYG